MYIKKHLTQFHFPNCRNFFFGPSHGHHKYNKNPPPQDTTDAPVPPAGAEAQPSQSSSSPSSAPKRNSRLRRSLSMKKLRSSFRRKEHSHVPPASKPHQWQQDEKLVRAGSCNFAVKVCDVFLLKIYSFVRVCVRVCICIQTGDINNRGTIVPGWGGVPRFILTL